MIHLLNQGWIGALIGLIGIGVAVVLYFRSRRRLEVAYRFQASNLIGGGKTTLPKEVEIRFSGTPVPRISRCLIIFWNAGTETVRCADSVEHDPVQIVLAENVSILVARVIKETRAVNGCSIAQVPGSEYLVTCSFDFLDAQDGCVFEILHTGDFAYPEVKLGVQFAGCLAGSRHEGISWSPVSSGSYSWPC